ncbi:hypothetical protein [Caballeronia sp. GAWG1-1]|uniref:hypothetical protein n=1 Tax=Caballeronia sp. GAWG1-1 TaxID=2921742 RepID=UPI0020278C19|nr:hypothetical protein [Caballeronia sp. GAWG1-1]
MARASAYEALKLAEDSEAAHTQWTTARARWQAEVGELEQATRALSDWGADVDRIRACDERVLSFARSTVDNQRALAEKEAAYEQAVRRAAEAKERLQTLQQSSDSIRAAVAAIAADLLAELGDSPVSGVKHGVIELRRRVAVQLEVIDPALRCLAEHERECREAVSKSERLKDEATQLHRQSAALHETTVRDRDTPKQPSDTLPNLI